MLLGMAVGVGGREGKADHRQQPQGEAEAGHGTAGFMKTSQCVMPLRPET